MSRLRAAWLLYFRRRAAIREYRRCTERTTWLFAEFEAIRAELRGALQAETAAANKMEEILKNDK